MRNAPPHLYRIARRVRFYSVLELGTFSNEIFWDLAKYGRRQKLGWSGLHLSLVYNLKYPG